MPVMAVEPGDPLSVRPHVRFANIIAGLCVLFGVHCESDPTTGPFLFLIGRILHRLSTRFAALAARVGAGNVALAQPKRPRAVPALVERAWDPMPRTRAWLLHLIPGVRAYLEQFEQLLADPEMAALLAAAPRAGRLLRPLWFMMSPHPLPAVLRVPPRPPAPTASGAQPATAVAVRAASRAAPDSRPPRQFRPRVVRVWDQLRPDPLFSI